MTDNTANEVMRVGTRGKAARAVTVFGGVFVVAYVAGLALVPSHAPNSGSPGERIVHYASVHRGQLLASDLLIALSLAAGVVFAAGVYRIIREAEGDGGWLAVASLATAVAAAGVFGAGTALLMAVAYRPTTDPAVARALWDAGWLAYNSSGFAFGTWIAIVAAAAVSHRALPRWTAWIGVPVALFNLIGPLAVKAGTGPFSPQGSFTLAVAVTFPVWVIAISLAAWRSARTQDDPLAAGDSRRHGARATV